MEESLNLIREFIKDKKYLDGEIENLKTFNFKELEGVEKYDGCPKGKYDSDNSKLAKAIYYVIWKDKLPELDTIEDIGTGKKYRGDTLNTFATLFGERIDEKQYLGVEKFSNDDRFLDSVENFHKIFQTIGNFALMPNIPLETSSETINTYRGFTSNWRDYFDRFLLELNYCLATDNNKNAILANLVDRNKLYFNFFNYNIEQISKVNFFEPYFSSDGQIQQFFKPYLYHWKNEKPTEQEYISYAEKYISKSTEIIDYRANKIISVLKSKGL